MIHRQPFGQTGHDSSAIIFGAFAVNCCDQATADQLLMRLMDHGVNHIDTAASYGDSELRVGPWMQHHRDEFFLATKTGRRVYAKAKEEIENSLVRLQTDCLDLIQLHNLVDEEQWDQAMAPGGALEAACDARKEGKVRYIGVTGHGLTVARMHLRSLEAFAFDSVLLPWNYVLWCNEEYRSDFNQLNEVCRERGVAVQTIKGVTRGPWGETPQSRNTWYQPFENQADINRAVHWVLGQDGLFLNSAGDPDLLPRLLAAGSTFRRAPHDDEMEDLMASAQMAPLFVD